MTTEEEAAIYRLVTVPGMGRVAVGRVLDAWREHPVRQEAFWAGSVEEYRTEWGLTPRASRFLCEGAEENQRLAVAEAAAARAADIELLSLLAPSYAALAAERNLPPVLFTRGNQDLLWGAGAAILHSRGATEEALAWGAEVAWLLAEAGIGLITGHNRDAYRRTAAAAKRAGSPLVIALDRPLHGEPAAGPGAEPVGTARLWDAQFRPERELVVSALGPREAWTPAHARLRDRIIVGTAAVVVAGAVRPGGNIAELCARALEADRAVLCSSFCHAALAAPLLPAESRTAAAVMIDAVRACGEALIQRRATSQVQRPGWIQRRWAAETTAFVTALQSIVGNAGQVERRLAGPLPDVFISRDPAANEVTVVVLLPGSTSGDESELVLVRRRSQPPRQDIEEQALVLTPREPILALDTLRSYLAHCRARVQSALRTPPP